MVDRTEAEIMAEAQVKIGSLKKDIQDLKLLNVEEGRYEAANAVMGLQGKFNTLHAEATEYLYKFAPGLADPLVAAGYGVGGGGGSR